MKSRNLITQRKPGDLEPVPVMGYMEYETQELHEIFLGLHGLRFMVYQPTDTCFLGVTSFKSHEEAENYISDKEDHHNLGCF